MCQFFFLYQSALINWNYFSLTILPNGEIYIIISWARSIRSEELSAGHWSCHLYFVTSIYGSGSCISVVYLWLS